MIPTLSIRIPVIPVLNGAYVARITISINHYASWTASDYAYVYQDANETPFTWDDVDIPRRSTRLLNKDKKNYKL